jgi:hypothetical protein
MPTPEEEKASFCEACKNVADKVRVRAKEMGLDYTPLPGCKASFILPGYAQHIGLQPAAMERILLEASVATGESDLALFDRNKPLLVNGDQKNLRYRGRALNRAKMIWQDGEIDSSLLIYSYTGFQYALAEAMRNVSVSPLVEKALRHLNKDFELAMNHVILTLYKDGKDSIGVHTDKLPTIGDEANDLIIVIKMGAEGRPFVLTELKGEGAKEFPPPFFNQKIMPGSLLCISPYDNKYSCAHGVPETVCGRTSSLVFRRVTKRMRRAEYEKKRIACEKTKQAAKKRKLNQTITQQNKGIRLVPY